METFKQTAKVGVAGSFFNQLMSNNSSIPEIGKGATRMSYSDRHAYEVVEISRDGKTVKLEALNAEHDKTKEGGQGHQNWILKPTGQFTTITWRNGAWRSIYSVVEFVDGYYEKFEKYESEVGYKKAHEEMIKPLLIDNGQLGLVQGKTKIKKSYPKMNILFGRREYYYDWEF